MTVRSVPVGELAPDQVERLWELYDAFYEHVDRPAFDRDLAEKDLVFLGTDAETGRIVGFSTALFYIHEHAGRRVGIYFSGDTFVHPDYWGQKSLHWAVLGALLLWKLRHPRTPLYWHLICSGYRTYLTLVRNFPTHWPDHRRPTPAFERGLLDAIGRGRYGARWRPDRGVVSADGPQPVLEATVAPLDPAVRALPEIAFFLRVNPGHARGDELAMLAPVDGPAVAWMVARWLARPLRRALGARSGARSGADEGLP